MTRSRTHDFPHDNPMLNQLSHRCAVGYFIQVLEIGSLYTSLKCVQYLGARHPLRAASSQLKKLHAHAQANLELLNEEQNP